MHVSKLYGGGIFSFPPPHNLLAYICLCTGKIRLVYETTSPPPSSSYVHTIMYNTTASSSTQTRHVRRKSHSPDPAAKRPRLDFGWYSIMCCCQFSTIMYSARNNTTLFIQLVSKMIVYVCKNISISFSGGPPSLPELYTSSQNTSASWCVLTAPHLGSFFSMMRQAVKCVASSRHVWVTLRIWC